MSTYMTSSMDKSYMLSIFHDLLSTALIPCPSSYDSSHVSSPSSSSYDASPFCNLKFVHKIIDIKIDKK